MRNPEESTGRQTSFSGMFPCPDPSAECGHREDHGRDNFLLWEKVLVSVGVRLPPPKVDCLKRTDNYVVLHGSPETNHNYILLPTCRVAGIECPYIWGPPAYPFYWNDAWSEAQVSGAAQVMYADIGLGVNSKPARTQDQLHIHMAGILSGVQGQLNSHEKAGRITSDPKKWQQQIVPVEGFDHQKRQTATRYYRALIFTSKADLNQNMFEFLGRHVPAAHADKAAQTVIVTRGTRAGSTS